MPNNDLKSQKQTGYGILAELRSVLATLSQSESLQPIIPPAQDFIDTYSAYLDGVSLNPLAKDTTPYAKALVDIPPAYDDNHLLESNRDWLKALNIFDCDDNPKACEIIVAWERLIDAQIDALKSLIPLSAEQWQIVWDLYEKKLEIEKALKALTGDNPDARPLRDTIQNIFGYEISLETNSETTKDWLNWQDELLNLLTANLHIAAFFQEMLGGNAAGLEAIRKFFAHDPDGNPIEILLGGANQYMGRVPLPKVCEENDEDCVQVAEEELRRVRLGSDVSVATIVHELGHQFDRWFRLLEDPDFDFAGNLGLRGYFENNLADQTGVGLDAIIYTNVVRGFAGKEILPDEIFADIFMTSVLDGQGFKVLSLELHPDDLDILQAGGYSTDFIRCEDGKATIPLNVPTINNEGERITALVVDCEDIDVGWRGDTNNASAVRNFVVGNENDSSVFLSFLQVLNQ